MADNVQLLKVASSSNPASVGGAIAKYFNEGRSVHLIAVGAGAINQMNKAIAIASGYLAPAGHRIAVVIGFTNTTVTDEFGVEKQKTALLHQIIKI